jgi:hypothetical protein
MTLRNRLARLEKQQAPDSPCPTCQLRRGFRILRQDGPDAVPLPKPDTDNGESCPRCGWQPVQLVEVVIRSREDFARFKELHPQDE